MGIRSAACSAAEPDSAFCSFRAWAAPRASGWRNEWRGQCGHHATKLIGDGWVTRPPAQRKPVLPVVDSGSSELRAATR